MPICRMQVLINGEWVEWNGQIQDGQFQLMDTEETPAPYVAAKETSIQTLLTILQDLNIKTLAEYNETSFTEGVLNAPEGVIWKGLDIYNDSTANTITITLKNGETTVFSTTLNTSGAVKSSLINEKFPDFDTIEISGTEPDLTILARG